MFNRFVIVLILTISHFAYGQYPYEYDTLSINHRMFGKVDSTDVLSGILPSTFDGGVGDKLMIASHFGQFVCMMENKLAKESMTIEVNLCVVPL